MKEFYEKYRTAILAVLMLFASLIGTTLGVKFTVQERRPGEDAEVIFILDNGREEVRVAETVKAEATPVEGVEYLVYKTSLFIAIKYLEIRAPKTSTDIDDRLLVALKALNTVTELEKVERALSLR